MATGYGGYKVGTVAEANAHIKAVEARVTKLETIPPPSVPPTPPPVHPPAPPIPPVHPPVVPPVVPPVTPAATWSTPKQLGPADAIAASGKNVYAVAGNGALTFMRSTDEGASFAPTLPLGVGKILLDRPLIAGNVVAFLSVLITSNIRDWACLPGQACRPVGDLYLHFSTDFGQTFTRNRITSGDAALRVALGYANGVFHATAMVWRNAPYFNADGSQVGTWDLKHWVSRDGGRTWTEKILMSGTNKIGAERPSLACVGGTVHIVAFTGVDGKPTNAIESGYVLTPGTEVFHFRSTDAGSSFVTEQLTNFPTRYSGRPDIVAAGNTVAIFYDTRSDDGKGNNILSRQSSDGGISFSPEIPIAVSTGDQTHAMPAISPDGQKVYVPWSDWAGPHQVKGRLSVDGGKTYGAEEFAGAGETPVSAISDNFVHLAFAAPGYGPTLHTRRNL